MNLNIKTKGITLTPAISDYVEKRMDSIEKLLQADSTAKCDIELARTTKHHKHGDIFKAEIHILAKGENIYATAEEEDLYTAIDIVKGEISQKLKSSKDKRKSLIKKGGAEVKKIIKGI